MHGVIENTAIETTQTKPKTWKRFVDGSFSIVKKTAITSFLNSLNNIDPNISFTIELEQDNKISFLDTLITQHGNNLKIDVFRKPTHTDRYLDFNSHHDIKHKISAARTLIHKALTLPSTHASKQDELNHITTTLKCNGYPDKIVKQILTDSTPNTIVPWPEELVGQFFKRFDDTDKPIGYVTLPYISGITDALRRILQKQNIKVATKPLKTLQRMFPSPKHQIAPEQRTNVVYNIPCSDSPWSYVGEIGRSFETRKKEHIRSVKNCKKGSSIAKHAWDLDHRIDFNNGKVIDSGNYRTRKTLESSHTAAIMNSDNNSKPLPKQFAALVRKTCNR